MFTGEAGGYMGLLIGASWLTLCELLDLFIYNLFLKLIYRQKIKKPVPIDQYQPTKVNAINVEGYKGPVIDFSENVQ